MDVIKDGKIFPDKVTPDTVWSIEIVFNYVNEVKRHKIVNVTNKELTQLRQNLFSVGVAYPVDPGHWIVIPPNEILSVDLWKQEYLINQY